jgi:hypothetical protein
MANILQRFFELEQRSVVRIRKKFVKLVSRHRHSGIFSSAINQLDCHSSPGETKDNAASPSTLITDRRGKSGNAIHGFYRLPPAPLPLPPRPAPSR